MHLILNRAVGATWKYLSLPASTYAMLADVELQNTCGRYLQFVSCKVRGLTLCRPPGGRYLLTIDATVGL